MKKHATASFWCISTCCVLSLCSCAVRKEIPTTPSLKVVAASGGAEVQRNNTRVPALKDLALLPGDKLLTGTGSMVTISAGSGRTLHLKQGSAVSIECAAVQSSTGFTITFDLDYGEIFSDLPSSASAGSDYTVATRNITVTGARACYSVSRSMGSGMGAVQVFEKEVAVVTGDQRSLTVAACEKVLVANDGTCGNAISLTQSDFDELAEWVGRDLVASMLAVSVCLAVKEEKPDLPPVWEGEPKKKCKPNATFKDKVSARDPEGSPVRYVLVKGPRGLTLHENSGEIRFKPQSPGTHDIQISAEDTAGNSTLLQYYLTAIGKLNAVLNLPRRVEAGTTLTLDASASVDSLGESAGLLFRFDADGNGTWDYPPSGSFAKDAIVKHLYDKSGTYSALVEVRDVGGRIERATQRVEVITPPGIRLAFTPAYGTVGTQYVISLQQAVADTGPGQRLLARWDLNGDGTWDVPAGGGFAEETEVKNMWDSPGTYTVWVEVEDANKTRVKASIEVPVYKGIRFDSLQGPDTVDVNETVIFTCIARDQDNASLRYSWDLAGTGRFSEKSDAPSTKHTYAEAGIFAVSCSVSNDKGSSASGARTLVVLNQAATVKAGGPYRSTANALVTFEGLAHDKDSKIVAYLWDFDNDGRFEWESSSTPKADHAFPRSGRFPVRFGARTDDGKVTQDTTYVSVTNRPPKAAAGDDVVVRRNAKVKLNGIGTDPDNNIVEYAWDFEGDGVFDWTSKKTGSTVQRFEYFSTAVFRVMDSDSMSSCDTVRIVICPEEMTTIPAKKICIDTYEWPNRAGVIPTVSVTFPEADSICRQQGKRLCSAREMEAVCKGGDAKRDYPYGTYFVVDNCNTFGNGHVVNKLAPSGEFGACVSPHGVFDMSGNVAEWTSSGKGDYAYVAGGSFQADDIRSMCGSFEPLKKDAKYIHVGFRCCK